jgi:ABC-type multidrug transport system ATPase subunit
MLEVRALTKRYGGHLAVDRVSFSVNRGEVVGYLGPNGSGKSTTVNMGGRAARAEERCDSGKKEARRRKPSCPPILLLSC